MRILLVLALLVLASQSAAADPCPYNANALGLGEGDRLQCSCAAGAPSQTIYGTDRYTSDSAICAAAIHAGIVDRGGGEVALTIGPGCQRFDGSERNGIKSNGYGAYAPTFGFSDPPPPCAEESAANSTKDRLARDCQAQGRSAEACRCEIDVLAREIGLDTASLLQAISDVVATGGEGATLAKAIEQALIDAGLGLTTLPALKAAAEKAQAVVAQECPQ